MKSLPAQNNYFTLSFRNTFNSRGCLTGRPVTPSDTASNLTAGYV